MTIPPDGETKCKQLINRHLSWLSGEYYEGMCTCVSGSNTGSELCEDLGYDEDRCNAQGCCLWSAGECVSDTANEWEQCSEWDNRDRLSYANDQYALDQAPGATCLGLCGQMDPCNDGNGDMCCMGMDGANFYGDFYSYRNLDRHDGGNACGCPDQTCTDAAAYDTANPPFNYCKQNTPHVCKESRRVEPQEMTLEQVMVDETCLAQCKNDPICFTPGQGLSWVADMGGDGKNLDYNDCTAYKLRTGMTYQAKCENSTNAFCYWDSNK